MNLFVYGTLQIPRIMFRAAGRVPPSRPALLPGHAALTLRDRAYPGLLPTSGASTPGLLYTGLTGKEILRLDRFEGEEYERVLRAVCLGRGGSLAAWCYRLRDDFLCLALPRTWRLKNFLDQNLSRFEAEFVLGRVDVYTS